jgi:hypothetical protein
MRADAPHWEKVCPTCLPESDQRTRFVKPALRRRAESNGLSHAEREELLREGLAMIYGGNINAKTKPHSR